MKELLLAIMFAALVMFGFYGLISGGDTSFRKPELKTIIGTWKINIMKSLANTMIDAEQIGRIEQLIDLECADVWVSSETKGTASYWVIKSDTTRCMDGDFK